MTFTPKKPDEMRKLAEAATGDVWEWRESNDHGVYMKTLSPGILVLGDYSGCGGPWGDTFDRANAAHIVACSPAQIIHDADLIEAQARRIEELEGALERIRDANPRNTNSATPDRMASWTQAVASAALSTPGAS